MSVSVYDLPNLNFKDEQEFKQWWITRLGSTKLSAAPDVFEIENEEKEPGFPDVLVVNADGRAIFYEIKLARKHGKFKFENTQPRFYKTHPALHINVVVWDAELKKTFVVDAGLAAQAALEKGEIVKGGIRLNVREL